MSAMSLFPPVESVPQLPPFRRLLVAGVYHASAPIHLALSCLSRRPLEHVILFTPSREAFATTNVEFRDSWIHEHGGDGIVMDALSRIEVMYPPTPAHLALFLSSLHVAEPSMDNEYMGNAVMSSPPAMIIIHELSWYMPENTLRNRPSVPLYLSLVAQAIAAVESMSTETSPTTLALFDSRLIDLRLPVLQIPSTYVYVEDQDEDEEPGVRREFVLEHIRHYFDAMTAFERAEHGGNATEHGSKAAPTGHLRLSFNSSPEDSLWDWAQVPVRLGLDDQPYTMLRWLSSRCNEARTAWSCTAS